MNNNYIPYQTPGGYPNQEYAPNINNNMNSMNPILMNDDSLYKEESYIENILRMNKGKIGKFYCTFPDSNDWRDSVFNGTIEQAGRDHLIIRNPNTGKWYIILMIYLNYVEFDGEINYINNFN